VRDLERHRHDAPRVVRERRRGQQDDVRAPAQAPHDLDRGFLTREFPEIFLDVLDLERPLLEVIMLDVIFHGNRHFI
jgi:hypothetical protein